MSNDAEKGQDVDAKALIAEINEAAKHPTISVRDAVSKAPQLAYELIRLVLAQHRPLLAGLYNTSRSARQLYEGSIDRWTALDFNATDNIGTLLQWVARHGVGAVNYGVFGMLQRSSANVYAAILIFECDKLLRFYKAQLDLPDLEAGPEFSGQAFTRILRAAGNQYRHGAFWATNPDVDKIDDVETLKMIGIEDVASADVPNHVLRVIGGTSYFEFEDSLFESLSTITQSAVAARSSP